MDNDKKPSPKLSEEISVKSTIDQNKKGRSRVNTSSPIQRENFNPQIEPNKDFKEVDYKKLMEKKDEQVKARNTKEAVDNKTQQKTPSQKTQAKSNSKPSLGGRGGGTGFRSQQKFIKGGKVLPKLMFDILSEDKTQDKPLEKDTFSNEQVEDIKMTMEEFQDNKPEFLEKLGQGKEAETPAMEVEEPNTDFEPEDNTPVTPDEEGEYFKLAMNEFSDDRPDFLRELDTEEMEEPDMGFYMDEPGFDSGQVGEDGSSDGGGDGGGDDD